VPLREAIERQLTVSGRLSDVSTLPLESSFIHVRGCEEPVTEAPPAASE
jgi:hypothetical protein